MDATSALFGAQAEADFRVARSIPRHDLSGQALGTSMFLAQQCIEKQLKAIMLRLNEAMAFEGGDRFLRGMSHRFYPKLHEIRKQFVEGLGMPPVPVLRLMELDTTGHAFERAGRVIGHMGRLWKRYTAPDSPVHVCMWKQSLHVRLEPDELCALDRFLAEDADGLFGAFGIQGAGGIIRGRLRNNAGSPPPMSGVIGDERKTAAAYQDYVWAPHQRLLPRFHDMHVARQDRIFSDVALRRLGGLARDEQGSAIKRLVAEFAFDGASLHAHSYLSLYPHHTLGRYPRRLPGGRTSAEIYASSVDSVLHNIYNVARFNLEMLRDRSSKLDGLCRTGHEHGYW